MNDFPTSTHPRPLDDPPAPTLRGRWQSAVVGAAVGIAVTTSAALIVISRHRPHETTAPFTIEKDAVRLGPGAAPMQFETALVELGAPLGRPPVTARVQTVESLTAPSFAPLDGRVVEVAIKIGDRVKEGERLVMVTSGDLASLVRERNAARLTIQTKQSLVDRLSRLVESRAASQNDLMVAQSELNEAKLAASAADARLRALTVTQSGESAYWILAARAGTVVQLDAVRGKQVGPDKDKPVATIADLDEVMVVSDVPQAEAAALAVGMRVAIRQLGGEKETTEGTIEVVSDILDSERQTVPIRVRVKNEGHALRPHQYVETTFVESGTERVLLVPSAAVVTDGSRSVVFVQTAPGVLKRTEVRLRRQTKDKTEILTGVAVGQRVVVRGALLLLNAIDIER